jgi:hypothetical protein
MEVAAILIAQIRVERLGLEAVLRIFPQIPAEAPLKVLLGIKKRRFL